MGTAFRKSAETAVEAFREKRNRSSQVGQHPPDSGKSLDDAAEHEPGGCNRRVRGKTDERRQTILGHGVRRRRIGGMHVDDGAELVRFFENR